LKSNPLHGLAPVHHSAAFKRRNLKLQLALRELSFGIFL
jgi:hypothetical protein